MNKFIDIIAEWPIILQGALGSALFAFSLWFLRFVYISITNLSKSVKEKRDLNDLKRYYIHEYYVNSNGLFYFSQGYLLVIYITLKGIISSIIIAIFWFLINRLVGRSMFFDIFFGGILIYKMVDIRKWFYPRLSKGSIENYDEDTVNRIRESLLDERLLERDIKKKIKTKEDEKGKIANEISILMNQLKGDRESDEGK